MIVFDSMFGDTRQIAYAIAEGMATWAPAEPDERVALVVVGGSARANGIRADAGPARLGLKEWLIALAAPSRRLAVATFDRRFRKPRWLTGSAAVAAARWLVRRGCTLATPPESFFIEHGQGPLLPGDLDRARRWGASLAHGTSAGEWAERAARPGR
jgi:hypothetical protein